MKQHDIILEKAGLSPEEIKALNEFDETKVADFKADDYIGKMRTGFETSLVNDVKFLEKLDPVKLPDTVLAKIDVAKLPDPVRKSFESGQYGRYVNELKDFYKKQGVDLNDEELKTAGKILEAGSVKHLQKMGLGKDQIEAVKEVQEKLQKAIQDKELLKTEYEGKIKTTAETEVTKANTTITRLIAGMKLSTMKGLVVDPSLVIQPLIDKLGAKYSIVLDGEELKLMSKENKLLDATDAAGKKIDFTTELQRLAIESKVINKELADKETKEVKKGSVTLEVDGDKTNIIGDSIAAKIAENIEKEKKVGS